MFLKDIPPPPTWALNPSGQCAEVIISQNSKMVYDLKIRNTEIGLMLGERIKMRSGNLFYGNDSKFTARARGILLALGLAWFGLIQAQAPASASIKGSVSDN